MWKMKTRLFVVIGMLAIVSTGLFVTLQTQFTDMPPCFNKDLNRPKPCTPEESILFYEHMGQEWMETKKQDMIETMRNNTFHEWIDLTKDDHSHWNVYQYYSFSEDLTKYMNDSDEGLDQGWITGIGAEDFISNFESDVSSDSKTIQDIVDYCTHKIKLALGEIPSRNPDGSYNILLDIPIVFENQTHYMDNNNCQLIQTWDGYSHSFGYEYEPKVIFSINSLEYYPNSDEICIPGQHVENNKHRIRNSTHIFNNDACMWEILEICTGYCGEQ